MSRRRLRPTTVLTSSSSDEDEPFPLQPPHFPPSPPQQPPLHDQDAVFQDATATPEPLENQFPSPNLIPIMHSVTLNSSHSTTTAAAAASTHTVSDEDFVDVPDNFSPPPAATDAFAASNCRVNDELRKMGVNLKREWIDSCKLGLQNRVPGFDNFDVETKAKLCFGQFLNSDMNNCGAGVLPQNVHRLHLVDLPGPFVLQVDEVINISCPIRERYNNAPAGNKRCLKLSMTDGVQRVFGMEYRPIKGVEVLAPSGFKVIIQNINVQRGLLMLVPEVIEILGGSVEELEAARQRLVQEVNKPPRGKRTRTGIVPSLSARATLAAWAQNGSANEAPSTNHVTENATSVQHAASHIRENESGAAPISSTSQTSQVGRITTEPPASGGYVQHSVHRKPAQSRSTEGAHFSVGAGVLPTSLEPTDAVLSKEPTDHVLSRETAQSSVRIDERMEASEQGLARVNTEPNSVSTTVVENEDSHMADYMEPPFVLCGEMELPFTYLASMFAKLDALQDSEPLIQGKIKCFLTGVKTFQFRGQSMFELRVYIDDGSLISEILIHHNVVQQLIGYSPEEITAALASSNTEVVKNMKNTVKQFQLFLVKFEGTMILEMNATSDTPVALEMNQGCPTSDVRLLLRRLKPVTSSTFSQNGELDVITLSP